MVVCVIFFYKRITSENHSRAAHSSIKMFDNNCGVNFLCFKYNIDSVKLFVVTPSYGCIHLLKASLPLFCHCHCHETKTLQMFK